MAGSSSMACARSRWRAFVARSPLAGWSSRARAASAVRADWVAFASPGERRGLLGEQQALPPRVDGELEAQPQQGDRGHDLHGRGRPGTGTSEGGHGARAGIQRAFKKELGEGGRQADGCGRPFQRRSGAAPRRRDVPCLRGRAPASRSATAGGNAARCARTTVPFSPAAPRR